MVTPWVMLEHVGSPIGQAVVWPFLLHLLLREATHSFVIPFLLRSHVDLLSPKRPVHVPPNKSPHRAGTSPQREPGPLHVCTRGDQNKTQEENWLVNGLKDYRYLSQTVKMTRG